MPCIIIAEIGINHNGDLEMAKQCVRAAKQAGADAVKFQNYYTEDFIRDEMLTYTYMSQGREITETQYDMFKRYELSDESVLALAAFCRRERILFASTPSSEKGVALLKKAKAAFVKNSSDQLTLLPLISAMAKSGLPTIISTGMATLGEVDDAVRAFREAGGTNLTLLHCTSAYPTLPDDAHLRKIPALRDAFGCPVGFSDHTEGVSAAIASIVFGACVIEKHFTLDKNLPGPDHGFSADPDELRSLVKSVRAVEKQLGSVVLEPAVGEMHNRAQSSLSCVATRDLPPGHVMALADIAFSRPGNGLRPKYVPWLTGRTLKRPVPKGQYFNFEEDFV